MVQARANHMHMCKHKDTPVTIFTGKSDPYAELRLAGSKRESRVIKKTLDPEWGERFEFEGMLHQLTTDVLEVEVKDHDLMFAAQNECPLGAAMVKQRILKDDKVNFD